jgi:RNA polymerase sigma-70 factor (ECF subfamily)
LRQTAVTTPRFDRASDAGTLSAVLAGDLDAYEGIVRHHNQRLFRIARSIVRDDAEAMDVVQESFISAWERLGDLKDPEALGVWLGRIVKNTALMRLRRSRRYQFMEELELENLREISVPPSRQSLPEREVATQELRRLLEQFIDELPEAFRMVFMLRAVEQCDIATTASILEIPEATVKTRFHRARRLVRQRVLEHCEVAGLSVHEFAGHRCDTVTRNVMEELKRRAGARRP